MATRPLARMTPALGGRLPVVPTLGALGATTLGLGALAYKAGAMAALGAIVAAVVVALLLSRAAVAVLLAVVAFVVAEGGKEFGVPVFSALYHKTPVKLSVFDLLLLLAVAATLLDLARPHVAMVLPEPFTIPLLGVVLALAFGFANAALGPGIPQFEVLGKLEAIAPLILFPLLIVNVVRSPSQLRWSLGAAGVLAFFKALLGLAVVVLAIAPSQIGLGRITYYEPTANYLMMMFLLALLAAALTRTSFPRWMVWAAPAVIAALLLSYRRTFWLATVMSALLVVIVASGRVGRRVLVPAAVLIAISGYLVVATGVAGGLQGSLVQRAQSIDPSKLSHNTQDRYRLAERRDVLVDLEAHPVAGLGVGVPWPEHYPLPFEYAFGHTYVHMAVLYWWMTCGALGLLAYLLIMGTGVAAGLRIWRRHSDPRVRAAGLAAGAGIVGLAVVELASTVIGPDQRGTALLGVVLGLLAVASREMRQGPGFSERSPGRIEA